MKKITFISLALFVLLSSAAESSFACSCLRSIKPVKMQVTDAFNNSTAIFTGKVLSVTPKSESELDVKIRVWKAWKGEFPDEITITTAANSAMCGYTFVVGKAYLVYANGTSDALVTTNCSRTTRFSDKRDVGYLNKLAGKRKIRTPPHV